MTLPNPESVKIFVGNENYPFKVNFCMRKNVMWKRWAINVGKHIPIVQLVFTFNTLVPDF